MSKKLYDLILILVFVCAPQLHAAQAHAARVSDPFRPPGTFSVRAATPASTGFTGWNLQEILLSGKRRIAIINNIAVVVGDNINGARLNEIYPTYVELQKGDEVIRRFISGLNIKKLSK